MTGNTPGASESGDPEVWRQRLVEAERKYHEAAREHAAAVDSGKGDGAVQSAAERRNVLRQEYLRMLRIFTDLVVRGKRPKE